MTAFCYCEKRLFFSAEIGILKNMYKKPQKGGKNMGKRITVALDAMGGDYAPLETVKGAVDAVKELDVNIKLVGSCGAASRGTGKISI